MVAYWKGKIGTPKEGQYGTFSIDAPYVPDSDTCTQAEYEAAHPPKTASQILLEAAQRGDRDAIKKLIDAQGGWATLTAAQKEKITKLMLGYAEVL